MATPAASRMEQDWLSQPALAKELRVSTDYLYGLTDNMKAKTA